MKITENTQSLKRRSDFNRLYRRGKNEAGGYVAVYAMKNKLSYNRLGLTVGKSVGKATVRTRTKRLLRECYREYSEYLPQGWDFIIVARSRANGKTLVQLKKDFAYTLKKLELL